MDSKDAKTIGGLLKNYHIEESRRRGAIINQRELAEHFEIDPLTFNKYYNDERKPRGENVRLMAIKLGPQVYDILGLQRPDPLLKILIHRWDNLTDKQKESLINIARQDINEDEGESNGTRIHNQKLGEDKLPH